MMKEIIFIIRNANIPHDDYKDLISCFIQTLKKFFKGDELSEMISLPDKKSEEEKIAAIIEKYGMGFDDVYKDGKYEGKLEFASALLDIGINEEIISKSTDISICEIKKFKRKL